MNLVSLSERLRSRLGDFDWMEEYLYMTLLAMEACLIYPWQQLFGMLSNHKGLPFWEICLLLWLAYWVATLLRRLDMSPGHKQAAIAAITILSALTMVRVHLYPDRPLWDISWIDAMVEQVLAVFSKDMFIILLTFVLWWRGVAMSSREYDTQQVWFRFRLGIAIMFIYLLIAIFAVHADMTHLVLTYFFFGLIALALARIMELGGARRSALSVREWIVLLVGATVGSLGTALLVSLFISRRTVGMVLGWLRPLGHLLAVIMWYVLMVLFYLFWTFAQLVFKALSRGGERAKPPEFQFLSPLPSPSALGETGGGIDIALLCKGLVLVLLIGGGLLLVMRAIRKLASKGEKRRELERESVWSSAQVANDLKEGLLAGWEQIKSLAGRLRVRPRRSTTSIRKLYASMADLAAELGYPRRPSVTPYEYRSLLHRAFAGGEAAVDDITEAYVRAHYGQVPDDPAELERLLGHWQLLRSLAEEQPRGEPVRG